MIRLPIVCALLLAAGLWAQDRDLGEDTDSDEAIAAMESELRTASLKLSIAYEGRGIRRFFAGRMKESLADFDRSLELHPARAPHHWQRGLVCYYAEAYEEGVEQFERHQTVNGTDVENAAWHFLCLSKLRGVEAARAKLYPYAGDRRVPLREIHALFAGTGGEEEVLAAAREVEDGPERTNSLCYAHLYLGLHHEAHGRDAEARKHMELAAKTYAMPHYMGEVARVHLRHRWGREPDK